MSGLRFWQKIYLFSLALFLTFLNVSIISVCLISKTQSDGAYVKQALTQQQVLMQKLVQDIGQVKALRPYALESVYKQAGQLFEAEGFWLEIAYNDTIVLQSEALKTAEKSVALSCNMGQRAYAAANLGSQSCFFITSSLTGSEHLNGFVITAVQSIEESEQAWNKTILLFTGAFIAMAVVLAVALYAALARISRPLVGLARTAESFAAGNHEARVRKVKGNDEIALLANSFNKMAQQAQNDMDELSGVAEEKQMLVDALSHEMRTPLTAIHGYAEYIQRASLTDGEKYEATEYIMSESHRLEQVANQLLKLAVLRSEELVKEPVKLLELMRRTYRTVFPKASKRGVKINMAKPPNDFIYGDEALLESLLINLIDNAVKACDEGGIVNVSVGLNEQQAAITVRDNGRGMSPEQLSKIGRPFYRADKARSRIEGGAGLGLSLCVQIVQCHNGTLKYNSVLGEGTTAVLTLPRTEKGAVV